MDETLLDVAGCAEFLGIPVQNVYKLVKRRAIPFLRMPSVEEGARAKLLRFHPRALEEWLFARMQKPKAEAGVPA